MTLIPQEHGNPSRVRCAQDALICGRLIAAEDHDIWFGGREDGAGARGEEVQVTRQAARPHGPTREADELIFLIGRA